jgi:hypothetical protein
MDVAFIIVFGTRWTFRAVPDGWKGVLTCPDCRSMEVFEEKEAIKAFTVYWWSVWTVERGGKLVECQRCQGRFDVPPELKPAATVAAASARPAPIG